MPYTKQIWQNGPNSPTPLSATRLSYMETGIQNATSTAESAQTTANAKLNVSDATSLVDARINDLTPNIATQVANTRVNALAPGIADARIPLYKKPLCVVVQTIEMWLNNAVFTPLWFEADQYDPWNMHALTGTHQRCYVPTGWGGLWELSGVINIKAHNATVGRRGAFWAVNGTRIDKGVGAMVPTTANADSHVAMNTRIVGLNAGDYVEMHGFQDSGVNLMTYVAAGSFGSQMQMKYLQPS